MDYVQCAKDIVKARTVMQASTAAKNDPYSWVLLSSLSMRHDQMWTGAQSATKVALSSPDAALRVLQEEGFQKLDYLLQDEEIKDSSLLAVWDLIIATRADMFATCSEKCPKLSLCDRCNFRGSFGSFAESMRTRSSKGSESCWPTQEKIR